MRFIHKKPPAASLGRLHAWASKRPRTWKDFKGTLKDLVKKALLSEQGFLCCYCGRRISIDDSHIDHLRPQGHAASRHLTFVYDNMLASCMKDNPKRVEDWHCGKKKDDWFHEEDFVHPLQPDCADHFTFYSSGRINPAEGSPRAPAAEKTIKKLGLDIKKLDNARYGAIHPYLDDRVSADDLARIIAELNCPDKDGRLEPFAFAIVAVLKGYVAPAPPLADHRRRPRSRR